MIGEVDLRAWGRGFVRGVSSPIMLIYLAATLGPELIRERMPLWLWPLFVLYAMIHDEEQPAAAKE